MGAPKTSLLSISVVFWWTLADNGSNCLYQEYLNGRGPGASSRFSPQSEFGG